MLNSCVRACVSMREWVCVSSLHAEVKIVQIIQRISLQYTNKILECEHDNFIIGV